MSSTSALKFSSSSAYSSFGILVITGFEIGAAEALGAKSRFLFNIEPIPEPSDKIAKLVADNLFIFEFMYFILLYNFYVHDLIIPLLNQKVKRK